MIPLSSPADGRRGCGAPAGRARMPGYARRAGLAGILAGAIVAQSAGSALACRDTLAPIVEVLIDSVVNISTTQQLKGPSGIPLPRVPKGSPFEEFFKDFFDNSPQPRQRRRVSSLGSGFVIDPSGLIVTNNHVISEADEIVVNFNDGSKLKVKEVVGRDPKTDLALLRVEPKAPLTAVGFGDSSRMRVGDCVIAIGNPFGLGGSVTSGIISAKKRDIKNGPYDEFLQTDAAINKGNSGGPLFNLNREVIGINTAIISPTGGSIGIGFAVPANTAVHVIDQLRQYGETRRGWLGVRIQSVTDEIAESLGMAKPKGALIASVSDNGPAAKGGIEAGDIILRFDGRDVASMRELPRIVARAPIGKSIEVEILRKGKRETVTITIGRLEEAALEAGEPKVDEDGRPQEQKLLGLSIGPLSDDLRKQYGIKDDVNGVVVTEVDPDSKAAEKNIKPGDVIVEVTQEAVSNPGEVKSRVDQIRRSGRKTVLFLIAGPDGELRFVAVPIEKDDKDDKGDKG